MASEQELNDHLDDSSIDINVGYSVENRASLCVPGQFDCCYLVYFLLLNLIVSVITYFVLTLVNPSSS